MNNINKYRIILASQSPRRREILTMAGLKFEVMPAEGEENCDALRPDELTMALSRAKAEEVFAKVTGVEAGTGTAGPGGPEEETGREGRKTAEGISRETGAVEQPLLVIGADTVVAYGSEILGKPKDLEDAYRMLRLLSGHTHQVYTGVTLLFRAGGDVGTGSPVVRRTFFEKTDVVFHELTDEEILEYVHTVEPLDKAGSYAIQGAFGKYIRKIDGDYYNVVGLPIQHIWQELKALPESGVSE